MLEADIENLGLRRLGLHDTPSPPTKSCDLLKQTLNSKGWEFSCPYNFVGSLPESFTQGLLVGKLLVGGLGVGVASHASKSYLIFVHCQHAGLDKSVELP